MKGNTVALILRHIPCILDISVNNRPYGTFHVDPHTTLSIYSMKVHASSFSVSDFK